MDRNYEGRQRGAAGISMLADGGSHRVGIPAPGRDAHHGGSSSSRLSPGSASSTSPSLHRNLLQASLSPPTSPPGALKPPRPPIPAPPPPRGIPIRGSGGGAAAHLHPPPLLLSQSAPAWPQSYLSPVPKAHRGMMRVPSEPEIQPFEEDHSAQWSSYSASTTTRPVSIPGGQRGGTGAVRSYRVVTASSPYASGSRGGPGGGGGGLGGGAETTLVIMEGDDEGTDLLSSSAAQRSLAGSLPRSMTTPDHSQHGSNTSQSGGNYYALLERAQSSTPRQPPTECPQDTSGLLPHHHSGHKQRRRSSTFFDTVGGSPQGNASSVLNRALGSNMRRSQSSNIISSGVGPGPSASDRSFGAHHHGGHAGGDAGSGYVVGSLGRSCDSGRHNTLGGTVGSGGDSVPPLLRARQGMSMADIQATAAIASSLPNLGFWNIPRAKRHSGGGGVSRNSSSGNLLGGPSGSSPRFAIAMPQAPAPLPVCLICLEFLTPDDFDCGNALALDCMCRGDVGLRHRACAIEWSNYKGNLTCDICKTPIRNLPPVDPAIAAAREAARLRRLPNFAVGGEPNLADYLFDFVRVAWVTMIVCIIFLQLPMMQSFALGAIAACVYCTLTRILYMCCRRPLPAAVAAAAAGGTAGGTSGATGSLAFGGGSGSVVNGGDGGSGRGGMLVGRDVRQDIEGGWLPNGLHVLQQPLLPGGDDVL